MTGPSRTPKKSPFDLGKRATDIDAELPWNEIREPRRCNFNCPQYIDPLDCGLIEKNVAFNFPCKLNYVEYNQALSSKERGG